MHGIGPGSVLGGRYTAQRRLSQHARFERWSASDTTLERDVVLLCFDADSPEAPAGLDAARRAAGVEDSRLVRVLDVGSQDGVSFVVEEPLPGAEPLASLLGEGGLPAEEARRIVGETASALETARVRGLHHQVLTPRSVLRAGDGSVKVRGLATEAALLEAEGTTSEAASRTDTVALVALAYAVLTSRWPLPGGDSGLEDAPRVVGGVAAPSEIAAGVPADLDLIARLTLNEDLGPTSPGDLAGQIAPWSARPAGGAPPPARPTGSRTEPLPRDPATGAVAPQQPPERRAAPSAAGGAPGAAPTDGTTSGSAPAARVGAAPAVIAAGAAAGGSVARGVGAAIGAAGSTAAAVGGKVGSFARAAADKAAEKAALRGERRHRENLSDDLFEGEDIRLSDALEETDEAIGPPLSILPESTADAPTRDQSKLAIVIVAAFVIVAALLGIWGLPRLSPAAVVLNEPTRPAVTRTVTGTPSPPAAPAPPTTSQPPSPTPTTFAPVAIVGANGFDPEGDGQEGNASAARAFDNNPATMWRSQYYLSEGFGGIQKSGIGLALDLGQQTDVHQVKVTLRGASDLTVYVTNRTSLDGAQELGKATGRDGDITLAAPGGTALKGQQVILWFTKLAPDGEGRFRAQVAEVQVS